jgi:hypothetical protein
VLLLDFLEGVVVYLSQFKLDCVQTILNSSQIFNKLFAYLLSYLYAIGLAYYLRVLQYNVCRLLYFIQIFIDLNALIAFQCYYVFLEDFHIIP